MTGRKPSKIWDYRRASVAVGLLVLLGAWRGALVLPAFAAPAWGANCLSCHDVVIPDVIAILNADTQADPDETATGAPDRGIRPTFQASPGTVKTLQVEVYGLNIDDTYAVELKRLRSPGVVSGELLTFGGDCLWAYWGEPGRYYTDPAFSFSWGSGPTLFSFDLTVDPGAPEDFYDVVFSVAGRATGTGDLFYAETHFYIQVMPSEEAIFRDQFETGDLTHWTLARQSP